MTTLTGGARLAGIVGWPVAHSRSPQLHGHWLNRYAIDGAYVPLPVPPERIGAALRALPALGFAGVNVTLPHKEAAARICDEVDAHARRIGAVNTIVVRDDGTLHGSNTDGYGFLESLRGEIAGWTVPDAALVLGAGGAARGVIVALMDAGCREVRICNRTYERAESLAAEFGGGCVACAWGERGDAVGGAGLVVNTTSLGMAGKPALDLPLGHLAGDAVVTDIVYTPLVTPLLAAAAARGARAVDGLGMLLHQARPGFAAWFGREPLADRALRQYVLRSLAVR